MLTTRGKVVVWMAAIAGYCTFVWFASQIYWT